MTKRALVTGSARGIGRAIARELAGDGIEVFGVDVLAQMSEPWLTGVLQGDLADASQCSALVRELPPIDILVNNAGVLLDKPLEATELDEIDHVIAVNLRAAILFAQALVPRMVDRSWGRVVNISSVGARTGGYAASGVYNTTKAGLISFTKYLARHYAPMGVTANAIAPGGIRTEMMAHLSDTEVDQFRSLIPVGRLGEPDDVAHAVSFMVSERSGYINGVTLDLNGGWVMT